MQEQIQVNINSGDTVPQTGYYVYGSHVENGSNTKCFVAEKAKSGIYLMKGSVAPKLGSCPHKVKWLFVV